MGRVAMPLFSHASAALSTPPRRVRVHLQLPHVSLRSEDFRRLRTGPASWERLRAITVCISSTKNDKSFYVAAVVKPLCTFFFFPLFFSLHTVFFRKYLICSNVHQCSFEQLNSDSHCKRLQGQRRPRPLSWGEHPMRPITW